MTALPIHNYFSRILACVVTRREFFCLDFARVAGLSRGRRGRTARGATLAILFSLASVVLLSGCAGVEAWARNHEREYRAEYGTGGGAISLTVRPTGGNDQRVTSDQIDRMFRELEAKRLLVPDEKFLTTHSNSKKDGAGRGAPARVHASEGRAAARPPADLGGLSK